MTTSAPLRSPLVSAEWLLERLGQPELALLDCRFALNDPQAGQRAYAQGHIPGAVYADLEQVLSGPPRGDGQGGRHPLPDPALLAAWLGRAGIGDHSTVVCYDDPADGKGFTAARAWWLLRWLGHREVYVLDGGWPGYLRAGGVGSETVPSPVPASFTPHVQHDMVADVSEVQNRAPEVILIDSRAPERYRGETEPLDRKAGHIPGAVNRFFAEGLDTQGHFKPARQQSERLGLEHAPTITYCGSGVSATPNLLARELAGVPLGAQNRLYPGSWSDWVSDVTRPIASGPEA